MKNGLISFLKNKLSSIKLNKNSKLIFLVLLFLFCCLIVNSIIKRNIYDNMKTDRFSIFYAKLVKLPAYKVNGEKIYYLDFLKNFNVLKFFYTKQSEKNSDFLIPSNIDIKSEVKKRMVNDVLINKLAKKYNIYATDREIYNEMKNFEKQAGDKDGLESTIKNLYNLSLDEFKEHYISRIIIKEKLNNIIRNDNKINLSRKIRTQNILGKLNELKNNPDAFSQLAKDNSDDITSAENGGEIGWISKGEMPEQFENIAFSMVKGQISDIIQTNYGYHIIKLLEKNDNQENPKIRVSHILIKTITLDEYLQNQINKVKIKEYIR